MSAKIIQINGCRINLDLLDQVMIQKGITQRKRNLYYNYLYSLK